MSNETRRNLSIQCVWAGQHPNEDDIEQILSDHALWLRTKGAQHPPPHNLERVVLSGAYLGGADLSKAQLHGANLLQANLQKANLYLADLSEATLLEANLLEANLMWTDLSGAILPRANLRGAKLMWAKLFNADLRDADLEQANAYMVAYNPKNLRCMGAQVTTCQGNLDFRRDVMDNHFIENVRRKHPLGGWLWHVTCDCGRSIWRWISVSALMALFFSGVFLALGPESFRYDDTLGFNRLSMLYHSVVTFTTFGFGDIAPLTPWAAFWVMVEVVVGYVMLAGLISIFANKLARRS